MHISSAIYLLVVAAIPLRSTYLLLREVQLHHSSSYGRQLTLYSTYWLLFFIAYSLQTHVDALLVQYLPQSVTFLTDFVVMSLMAWLYSPYYQVHSY